ncbi:hypothetical protein [Flavobacterium poyangense]|uniref:hypothetical protein n=1 Tax=Flavobacterium poyangense TaxID=2204302 RepID=UPI00142014D6|nr:hypothetical protein [Flavobacterium sp. JXAS1]
MDKARFLRFIDYFSICICKDRQSLLWGFRIVKIGKIFVITPEVLFEKEEEKRIPGLHYEVTQNALLNVYRKIIKKYEVQISELQQKN